MPYKHTADPSFFWFVTARLAAILAAKTGPFRGKDSTVTRGPEARDTLLTGCYPVAT